MFGGREAGGEKRNLNQEEPPGTRVGTHRMIAKTLVVISVKY